MSSIRSNKELIKELQDKQIRDFYVSDHINIGLSSQIRALRKKRGWTQKDLADRLGKTQPWINKIENNYSGFSLQTLKELASVFDVALIIRFAPFGDLVQWELALSPEKLEPVSFEEDPYFKPPVYEFATQGGVVVGGGGIVNFINPSQPPMPSLPFKTEPTDELCKHREAKEKAKQEELNRKLKSYMGVGEQNASAFG